MTAAAKPGVLPDITRSLSGPIDHRAHRAFVVPGLSVPPSLLAARADRCSSRWIFRPDSTFRRDDVGAPWQAFDIRIARRDHHVHSKAFWLWRLNAFTTSGRREFGTKCRPYLDMDPSARRRRPRETSLAELGEVGGQDWTGRSGGEPSGPRLHRSPNTRRAQGQRGNRDPAGTAADWEARVVFCSGADREMRVSRGWRDPAVQRLC